MTAKRVKYPGKLGRRITRRETEYAISEAQRKERGGRLEALLSASEKWEAERFFELLYFFRTRHQDKTKWFQLARALAGAHVPGFGFVGSRAGRPRKHVRLPSVADTSHQERGRPKKYTDENRKGLVRIVRETQEKHGLKRRGKDKQALKIILTAYAKKEGLSVEKLLREELGFFSKQLSKAKNKK